jgi:flagellar hook-basal body complex protein FliE
MSITAIGGIQLPNAAALNPTSAIGAPPAADAAGVDADSMGNLFADTLQGTISSQANADGLMQQAATGDLTNLTQVMTAMTEAQLSTQLTVAVRNKAVESFNEVMRMQI